MRIIIISTGVFAVGKGGTHGCSGYSGLEHLAWQQARGLAAKGHQVSLVAPEGSTCPGCNIITIGPERTWDEATAYNSYWKELLNTDCILDNTWQKHSYLLKAERQLKIPVLGICHAPVDTMFKSLPPGVEKPCFVCISDDQRNHFEALFGREARTARNGIDVNYYKPLGLPRSNRFLFLARFSTIKGPQFAIDACVKNNAALDMVGDTQITNEPQLLEYCQSKADGKQIKMIGGCSRAECVHWFSQNHCLLHPNKLFREPLGLAPLEAQSCQMPVIAWRRGAMTETVKHGETGWLVNSEEQLADAVKNCVIDDTMRKRCREWVADNFSEQHMIERYHNLCEEAVSGGW